MYLKGMEIQGFKSFARKTTLEFKNGITGIVGPNGSGKSNVADALRWVLGEQKVKALRGLKMEDVIFAGTEKRNPLSFAYVAITFDNSDRQLKVDYSEVKVARKLYRSGESEYLLNGSPVRLKDVRELFYDTGIGKEGYSIIGQGQIDKILQGKVEERRELFDEACGIVKYKKRKSAALKKLENERLNLERVNDIIGELEKRSGPLKRQSEAANNFINYKNELKKLDINLFLKEGSELREKIKETEEKELIASKELNETKEELSEIKKEHEKTLKTIAALESEAEEIKAQISKGNIIKENLAGRINVLNEQINSARKSGEHYSEKKENFLYGINSAKEEKASLEKEKDECAKKLDTTIKQRNDISGELIDIRNGLAQSEAESETLKEAQLENIRKKGEINAQLERLYANTEEIEKKKADIENTVKNYLENTRKQQEQIDALFEEFKLQKEKVNALEEQIHDKNSYIDSLEEKNAGLNKTLSSLKLEETKANTRLESIRNITERYEGYSGAIKEVMFLKPKKKGITGVVADIIRVPKEYETAIETALGGSIQNIVTDNETTAKESIEYLKANRLGRATFLPLNAVRGRGQFRFPQALSEKGAIGLASSLVNVDGVYLDLCDYLLGQILVADTIDNALKIAGKYRYSFIIVTLEGELLSRGGALSGGAYKNRSNLLGRRREIEELEKEISSYQEKMKETSKSLAAIFDCKKVLSENLAALNESLQEERILLNTLNINLERAQTDKKELAEEFENVKLQSEKAAEDEEALKLKSENLAAELENNETENIKIKEEISFLEANILKQKDKEEHLRVNAGEMDIEISRLKEQLSFITGSCIKCENNIAGLENELAELEKSGKNPSADIEAKLDEASQAAAQIKRAEDEISALSIKLADLEDTREEAIYENSDFLSRHDELSEKISSLDREVYRLEQLAEKYEDRFNSKADYIWQEYELTYNNASFFSESCDLSVSEIKEGISDLKIKIKNLGTINVNSIEEYKEVKERYEFLSSQRDDILKAEDDLVKIINDLDSRMKAQFSEEFAKISREFSRVFEIMFGGGYGMLTLADENDILGSDIEITAQPPGKKLQNMMQLSGGEKALTAIVALFAIQNLKPSPFCILDEIEAALDDSNITKFSNYLMLLSGKIQFIVITHRKKTMEACDRLYGITMQEKGISSLVFVNLEEAQLSAENGADI